MPTHEPILPHWRERIQLLKVELVVTQSGGSEVTVHLGTPSGATFTGHGAGLGHREGTMRATVEATLRALAPLCGDRLHLSLRGTRSLRAFDALLVIVALNARTGPGGAGRPPFDPPGDRRGSEAPTIYRLIGTVAAPEEDLVRGTVMAVLDAANRVVEGYALLDAPQTSRPSDQE